MLPTISRKEYTLFSRLLRVTHFQFAFALLTFLFSWGFTFQAHAEKASTEEWNISADKVSHLENPNSIIAQGNVVLTKQEKLPPQKSKAEIRSSIWADLLEEDVKETELVANEVDQAPAPEFQTTMTIKADWIAYDVELESIKAKGNVILFYPPHGILLVIFLVVFGLFPGISDCYSDSIEVHRKRDELLAFSVCIEIITDRHLKQQLLLVSIVSYRTTSDFVL